MSKRDHDTEIWSEDWFLNLTDAEMLFWFYIKDKCDHAGFWRPNFKAFEISTNRRIKIDDFISKMNAEKQRVKVLENGRWFICSFIEFQYCGKLNLKNHFHKSVYDTFRKNIPNENTMTYGFEVFETSSRPQGEVKETSIKNEEQKTKKEGVKGEIEKTWRTDYQTYYDQCNAAFDALLEDWNWIKERKSYHPGLNIRKSTEKMFFDFWGTPAGWKNKKSSRSKEMDWMATVNNGLSMKCNQVWIQRNETDEESEFIKTMERRNAEKK